jgi:pimeloyl-ACP methyl ester carboxylesterase
MIDEKRMIQLNGAPQKIHIRGAVGQPVILFLHGGPGLCNRHEIMAQIGLAKDFILVAWDQRGSGGSYAAGKAGLTNNQLVADAHELVLYLCKKFDIGKVVVAGISWGSILAIMLADRYPENIAAVVTYGQAVMSSGEKLSYNFVIESARAANDRKSVRSLEKIGAPSERGLYRGGLKSMMKQRRILMKYGGWSPYRRSYFTVALKPILRGVLSGEYSLKDLVGIAKGSSESVEKVIMKDMPKFNILETNAKLSVPIFILQGREDWVCPSSLVEKYFVKIKAPKKELIWFENSGHDTMADEPEKFADEMSRISRLFL